MILLPSADDEPAVPPDVAEAIVQAGRRMDARHWVPATAGNISARLDGDRIAITRSGVHKGQLEPDDVIPVDLDGRPLSDWGRPSVETLLHCQLYRARPELGAVVHGHSVAATVLSLAHPGPSLAFAGYEMLKAFGQPTHDGSVELPVVENDQDMGRMLGMVGALLPDNNIGYLIRGHGSYAWGPDLDTAFVRFEALEFLLECELTRRRLA